MDSATANGIPPDRFAKLMIKAIKNINEKQKCVLFLSLTSKIVEKSIATV